MKTNILRLNSLLMGMFIAGTFTACGSGGGETGETAGAVTDGVAEPVPTPVGEMDAQGGSNFNALLQEYMDVKEALVKDEYDRAKDEADDLTELFSSIAETEGTEQQLSEQQLNQLREATSQLVAAPDIATQRQYFETLSNELYQLAQADELTEQTLYWQHCPMAMNDKGASWLSLKEEIQNPYMGQEMPRCGSVEEVLNKE